MRRSVYGVVALVLGTSCVSIAASDRAQAAIAGAQLVYFRDTRTELCFAGRYLIFKEAVLTNVPCTEAVQRLIASQAPSVIPGADATSPSEPVRTGATYSR
jgi:hypothetical protein